MRALFLSEGFEAHIIPQRSASKTKLRRWIPELFAPDSPLPRTAVCSNRTTRRAANAADIKIWPLWRAPGSLIAD